MSSNGDVSALIVKYILKAPNEFELNTVVSEGSKQVITMAVETLYFWLKFSLIVNSLDAQIVSSRLKIISELYTRCFLHSCQTALSFNMLYMLQTISAFIPSIRN